MCGLTGAYSPSPLTENELDTVGRLVILSHFRGSDSTGFMSIWEGKGGTKDQKHPPKFMHWKGLAHPCDFVLSSWEVMKEKAFKKLNPNVLAFHTRYATKGDVSIPNAHPFDFPSVLGMHNGTVSMGLKFEKECQTDSEAIYKEIDSIGIDEFIKREPVYGAMALVFYDKKKKTLNFWRNSQRPLHFIAQNRVLYWASEARDLVNATNILSTPEPIEFSETANQAIPDKKILSLPENTLVSIDMQFTTFCWSMKKLAKPVTLYSSGGGEDYYTGSHCRGMGADAFDNQTWVRDRQISAAGSNNNRNSTVWKSQKELCGIRLQLMGPSSKTSPFKRKAFDVRGVKGTVMIHDTSIYCKKHHRFSSYDVWRQCCNGPLAAYASAEVRYAVELDAFLRAFEYDDLVVWRRANPTLFLNELQRKYAAVDKVQRLKMSRLLGLSTSTLKQIVRGKTAFWNYVDKPYSHKNDGSIVIFDTIAELSDEFLSFWEVSDAPTVEVDKKLLAEAVKDEKEPDYNDDLPFEMQEKPSNNVVPLLSAPEMTEDLKYPVGPDGKKVSFAKFAERTRLGCCNCANAVSFREELYWITEEDFICEDCQDFLTAPAGMTQAMNLGIASELQNISDTSSARKIARLHGRSIAEQTSSHMN